MVDTPTINQLSNVIAQATAPAFLLGALSGFIAILIGRLNRIIDRPLAGLPADSASAGREIKLLKRRAVLINVAIVWAVASSICTALLLILAFLIAFFNFPHEYGVGLLFAGALGMFAMSLINLGREVNLAVMDFDHFG